LSPHISSQFILEMCAATENRKKKLLWVQCRLSLFKVIDVDTPLTFVGIDDLLTLMTLNDLELSK